MNTEKLVKRFDQYFNRRMSQKMLKLREYIKEYFSLVTEVEGAYVPRIFILRLEKSGCYETAIVCTVDNPTLIPPTDLIIFVENLNDWKVKVLGLLHTDDMFITLSPYLESVDNYDYLKIIPFKHDFREEIGHLLKSNLRPLPPSSELLGVDMLPTFEEEELAYQDPTFQ